jgi:hypothetical protein
MPRRLVVARAWSALQAHCAPTFSRVGRVAGCCVPALGLWNLLQRKALRFPVSPVEG